MTGLYIQELQKLVADQREAQAAEDRAAELGMAEAAQTRLAPLVERLGRLLASIPDGVQRRGLGIPELQASLRGRQGRQAHQGEIAAALRSRGWAARRSWKKGSADGFKSRWFPPEA